jgi:hypothetical protein
MVEQTLALAVQITTMILTRATLLCVVGMSIYVALARLLGIGELAERVGKLRRTLRVRQLT